MEPASNLKTRTSTKVEKVFTFRDALRDSALINVLILLIISLTCEIEIAPQKQIMVRIHSIPALKKGKEKTAKQKLKSEKLTPPKVLKKIPEVIEAKESPLVRRNMTNKPHPAIKKAPLPTPKEKKISSLKPPVYEEKLKLPTREELLQMLTKRQAAFSTRNQEKGQRGTINWEGGQNRQLLYEPEKPKIPEQYKNMRFEHDCLIKFWVNSEGHVVRTAVEQSTGVSKLDQIYISYIKNLRFEPVAGRRLVIGYRGFRYQVD